MNVCFYKEMYRITYDYVSDFRCRLVLRMVPLDWTIELC